MISNVFVRIDPRSDGVSDIQKFLKINWRKEFVAVEVFDPVNSEVGRPCVESDGIGERRFSRRPVITEHTRRFAGYREST